VEEEEEEKKKKKRKKKVHSITCLECPNGK
jgi:hypothetical protein